jgi:hypothetical protein
MIPAEVRQFIQDKPEYRHKELTIMDYPVHSIVRFASTIAAGPPVVATIDTTPRVGFSYGVSQDMAAAGRAGVVATQADTNLQAGGQTRDQADVFIYGLSAMVEPNSEAGFLADLFRETDLTISTNGDTTVPIGKMADYPGPGGLFGAARSSLLIPAIDGTGGVDGGAGVSLSFASNGNPTAHSFRQFHSPIFWSGVGGGADSSLALVATPRRTITKTSAVARAAAAGVAVFTPITAAIGIVDIRFVLRAASVRVRSANV